MESPGLLEARRRIEVAARGKAEELDLGGLGLTEILEELYALAHLKVLYLGAPKYLQKIPYWKRTQEDQKKRNALRALPPALFTSLPHLTHLHLDQNGLVALPMEIVALTGLTSLGLSNNHIGADGARGGSPPAPRPVYPNGLYTNGASPQPVRIGMADADRPSSAVASPIELRDCPNAERQSPLRPLDLGLLPLFCAADR